MQFSKRKLLGVLAGTAVGVAATGWVTPAVAQQPIKIGTSIAQTGPLDGVSYVGRRRQRTRWLAQSQG